MKKFIYKFTYNYSGGEIITRVEDLEREENCSEDIQNDSEGLIRLNKFHSILEDKLLVKIPIEDIEVSRIFIKK